MVQSMVPDNHCESLGEEDLSRAAVLRGTIMVDRIRARRIINAKEFHLRYTQNGGGIDYKLGPMRFKRRWLTDQT
jgi:hypothetical protein